MPVSKETAHEKSDIRSAKYKVAPARFQAPVIGEKSQRQHSLRSIPFLTAHKAIKAGNARITLTATNVWGDGTGYQMLLDADADTYGRIIPDPAVTDQGTLIAEEGDVSAEIYAEFEYKIPTNADGALNTSNIVMGNSISIDIPAGTYDYVIVNPTPDTGNPDNGYDNYMWIASGSNSRGNDYVFEEGKLYHFYVSFNETTGNDQVAITISALDAPAVLSDFQAVANPNPAILTCDLSWKNPSVTIGGDPLTSISLITITRDGEEIHTINNPTPGITMTWTDNTPANGYHTYTIYATNDAGDSPVSTVKDILVGVDPCTIAITDFPYIEGFEDMETIACWMQEYVSGNIAWGIRSGSAGGVFANKPHSGSYNVFFYNSSYTAEVTKLISHKLDLTSLDNPSLSFWFGQEDWDGDQDELRVYYKTSDGGQWTRIFEHTVSVKEWTMVTLSLPNPSDDYYIAFEGTAKYGRGVVLDDITIKDLPAYDASVVSIDEPINGANLTNAETVAITVKNNGIQTINNLTVKFEVNGVLVGNETITAPIISMAEYKYVFTAKADLSSVETYTIKAYTELANDAEPGNNSAVKEVTNYGDMAVMGNTPSYTACNFEFTDDGVYENYISSTNETQTITLYPAETGKKLKVDFTELYVSEYYLYWGLFPVPGDTLFVYEGNAVDESKQKEALTGDYSNNLPSLISYADDGSFTFVFKKSSGENRSGWLADINCITPHDNDAGIISIISPKKGGETNAQVTVRFKNFGLNAITSMDIAYKINSAAPVVETFTGNVVPGGEVEYTFNTTADLSAFDTYQMEIYTRLTGDGDTGNDKVSATIEFKPEVQIYGYRIFENNSEAPDGYISFSTHNPETPDVKSTYTDGENTIGSGEYNNNKLYGYTYQNSTAKNFIQLTDSWVPENSTEVTIYAREMTYDYSAETMYAAHSTTLTATKLYTVDLETGVLTEVADLDVFVVGMACHLDGRLFVVSSEGNLYTINKSDGTKTLVGGTGVVASTYLQSMAFDHNTGRLFWAYINEATDGSLYEINPATGAAYYLGLIGNSTEVVSLYIPYTHETNIPVNEALNQVLLYPNPASSTTRLSGIPENSDIAIYDISGRAVKQYRATVSELDININFESGTYFVKISKGDNSIVKKLIVK